jgi:hypothetical protein
MYTSTLLLALSGVLPVADVAQAPVWQKDYGTASKLGTRAKKPLAVFLGSGANGWQRIARDGDLSSEVKQLLADQYICVHIDTSTSAGKSLAGSFEMTGGLGIVISDRSGKVQAFRHEGDLADSDLVRYLQRYSDSRHVVRITETNPSERESYYWPGEVSPSYYAPAPSYYVPSYYPTRSFRSGGC